MVVRLKLSDSRTLASAELWWVANGRFSFSVGGTPVGAAGDSGDAGTFSSCDEDAWELDGLVEIRTIVFWVGSGVVAWLQVGLDATRHLRHGGVQKIVLAGS